MLSVCQRGILCHARSRICLSASTQLPRVSPFSSISRHETSPAHSLGLGDLAEELEALDLKELVRVPPRGGATPNEFYSDLFEHNVRVNHYVPGVGSERGSGVLEWGERQPDVVEMVFDSQPDMVQSIHSLSRPDRLFLPYQLDMMASMSVRPTIKYLERALVLGGGGGTLARYLRHALPWMHVDVVEIDQTVVNLCSTHFGLDVDGDPLLSMHVTDAMEFLERSAVPWMAKELSGDRTGLSNVTGRSTDKYDLIIQDAVSQNPSELLGPAAVAHMTRLLNPDGLLLTNLYCRHAGQMEAIQTLKQAFPTALYGLSSQPQLQSQGDSHEREGEGQESQPETARRPVLNPNVVITGLKSSYMRPKKEGGVVVTRREAPVDTRSPEQRYEARVDSAVQLMEAGILPAPALSSVLDVVELSENV
jgi:SAM-dependent methyltransferase